MLGLGFASGMPNPVTGSTLSAWMHEVEIDPTTVGLFSVVTLPYTFKFLWAAVMDRYQVPWLGRRRGWMALLQIILFGVIALLGSLDPVSETTLVAAVALVVCFMSASLDIATDAYRTDVLAPYERASGTAVFVAGYQVGLIAASGGALFFSDLLPWSTIYWGLAALILVGLVTTLLAPEPEAPPATPKTLRDAVVKPFAEFVRRHGVGTAALVLAVVMTYKVGDAFAGHMLTYFLLDMDYSAMEIGAIHKGLGLAASIGGALLGGGLVARFGMRLSLLAFGVLQAVANVLYAVLAVVEVNHTLLVVSITVDNLCGGLGTAAFVAFLMSQCDKRFTALQYALLSSAATLLGKILAMGSGWVAEQYGWPFFFVLSILFAVPALVIILVRPDLCGNEGSLSYLLFHGLKKEKSADHKEES